MGLIQKYKDFRAYESRAVQTLEEVLLQAKLSEGTITKEQAMSIPAVSACIDRINDIVSSLNIKLYQEIDGKTTEIIDNRTFLLNKNTGDTLNPNDFKKAMVTDYILEGNSYAFVDKTGATIRSLRYVDCISVSTIFPTAPIFKDYDIYVDGQKYLPFQFIRMLRHTKNGSKGTGIISENNGALTVAYLTQEFEKTLLRTGGNKHGFLKAKNKLAPEALTALRTAWNNLYNNDSSNMMILNDGIDFTEAQSTSVEMQLNETKKSNGSEICRLIGVPQGLLDGTMTESGFNTFIKIYISGILNVFESAVNSVLLTEKEKINCYFQFDTSDLLKGSLKERYLAYQSACMSGFMTKNEIRNKENMAEIDGLDVISMSLADVIFDIKTKSYFVPNMGLKTDLKTNSTNSNDTKPIVDNVTPQEAIK
ncbi:phage portal protein [Clostridium estertheticum]|uniref:phage portal protein n=1 Tax=Clostridium estertheticum TaxID=238834 RepID=UPI001C6F29E5|nr:phage portal protein [Clostridium estertheticum]MBW9170771.1 phage portal protein [Clostridium estertheticum]WLC74390.1 phage portal protein [Clostridium estertheticum]